MPLRGQNVEQGYERQSSASTNVSNADNPISCVRKAQRCCQCSLKVSLYIKGGLAEILLNFAAKTASEYLQRTYLTKS